VSLVLHLCVLMVVTGLSFSAKHERPLASYEVSLVTLPVPAQVEPSAVEPAPPPPSEPASDLPKPPAQTDRASDQRTTTLVEADPAKGKAAAPKVAPALTRPPLPEARESGKQPENPMQDVLRGIVLPPEAPKLGSARPAPASPPAAQTNEPKVEAAQQKLRKDIRSLVDPLTVPTQAVPRDEPKVAAKQEDVTKPAMAIQVPGADPGFNQYLALVQNKISSQWAAPPVGLTGQRLQVIIRFRLDRSGTVTDVVIEQTSGNDYYDMAGQRAVLKASPLPPFPRNVSERSLDAHFSFTVGERAG
jgi:TonB family protein